MTTAVLYARISVTDDRVPKVENQLTQLRKLARERGYAVLAEYADDGISASSGEARPAWERLLVDLNAGKFQVLMATEEARMCRNELEKAGLIMACAKARVTWLTKRDGEVDPADPNGALMGNLRGAIDAHEGRRKAQRMRDANEIRRASGEPITNTTVPFGWLPDRITVCDKEAALIRQGTDMILAGKSLNQVVLAWRATNVKPRSAKAWTRISVRKVLVRWRNCGVVSYSQVDPLNRKRRLPDQVVQGVEGAWATIVTQEELEAVRMLLGNGDGMKKKASRLCSGLARCACGEYMICSSSSGKPIYICSARIRGVAAAGSHASIAVHLLDPKVIDWVLNAYLQRPKQTANAADTVETAQLAALYQRRGAVAATVSQIQADREAGLYTREEAATRLAGYRRNAAQLEAEVASLQARSANAALTAETWQELAERPARTVGQHLVTHAMQLHGWDRKTAVKSVQLFARWEEIDLDQQRTLVKSLLTITVAPGTKADDRVTISIRDAETDLGR